MADVTLSSAMRSNLLSLQNTSKLTGQTQLRLATGKKVNSALDNPQSYFNSQTLLGAASDLGKLLDNVGQAIQLVQTANQGITSLTSLVNQAQAIAQQAQSEAVGGAVELGTTNLTAAQAASITTIAGVVAGNTFSVAMNGTTTTFTIAAGETLATFVSQLNTISGMNAQIVAGTVSPNVTVRLQSTNGQAFTTANIAGTAFTNIVGVPGAFAAANTAPPDQVTLQNQYNAVRTQIDQLVADTTYGGVGLLNGNSQTVKFNALGTSTLTLTGVTFTSAGLNISSAAGANDFSNVGQIQTDLLQIENALLTIRAQATAFSNNLGVLQTRSDFITNIVNTYKAGSDALVNADQNEEGANLLALQTQQQLGIQALSLASQANQSVLRLFQ